MVFIFGRFLKSAEIWILPLICAEKALKAVSLFSVPKSHYRVAHAEETPLSHGEPTHCALAWEHQWFSELSSQLWNAKCSSLSLICADMPRSNPLVPPKCLWWKQWEFSHQPGMEWTHQWELQCAGEGGTLWDTNLQHHRTERFIGCEMMLLVWLWD